MGERVPGPHNTAPIGRQLRNLNLTLLKHSEHPLILRLNLPKVIVGSPSDFEVDSETVGQDTKTPISQRLERDMIGRRISVKIEKPVVTLDVETGLLRGTAVLSIPSSAYPESIKPPTKIPVTITIRLPRNPWDLKHPSAAVQACWHPFSDMPGAGACAEAKIEVKYDQALLNRVIAAATRAADAAQNPSVQKTVELGYDVAELFRQVIPQMVKSLSIEASGRAPLTRFHASLNPFEKVFKYRVGGFNLIPDGQIFDFTVPAYGFSAGSIGPRSSWSVTAGLLAYPSLPSIFAGEHFSQMVPAYLYGEVHAATHVTNGLELGVRLTLAGNIWQIGGVQPREAEPSLLQQAMDAKDDKNPTDVKPWMMFQVEAKF